MLSAAPSLAMISANSGEVTTQPWVEDEEEVQDKIIVEIINKNAIFFNILSPF
jgi:hypothetical protein